MNETELEAKLKELSVKFTASTFKPNAQEISVYEQLLAIIDQKEKDLASKQKEINNAKNQGPMPAGVELKPVHPDFLQPLRQI